MSGIDGFDGFDAAREALRRYKTLAEVDQNASTVQGDGSPPTRPEARQRGSPEHLRDLTYTLELLVDEAARARRRHSELCAQTETALRETRSEMMALAGRVSWQDRALAALSVGSGGLLAALCALALAVLALWAQL